jgi:hypothetical protein
VIGIGTYLEISITRVIEFSAKSRDMIFALEYLLETRLVKIPVPEPRSKIDSGISLSGLSFLIGD